jgi:hypothetical protein
MVRKLLLGLSACIGSFVYAEDAPQSSKKINAHGFSIALNSGPLFFVPVVDWDKHFTNVNFRFQKKINNFTVGGDLKGGYLYRPGFGLVVGTLINEQNWVGIGMYYNYILHDINKIFGHFFPVHGSLQYRHYFDNQMFLGMDLEIAQIGSIACGVSGNIGYEW